MWRHQSQVNSCSWGKAIGPSLSTQAFPLNFLRNTILRMGLYLLLQFMHKQTFVRRWIMSSPKSISWKLWTSLHRNVAAFGYRVFTEVMELKWKPLRATKRIPVEKTGKGRGGLYEVGRREPSTKTHSLIPSEGITASTFISNLKHPVLRDKDFYAHVYHWWLTFECGLMNKNCSAEVPSL